MVLTDEHMNEFCLLIVERAKIFINNEQAKNVIESAIKVAVEWIKNKTNIADKLYNYLDNEENSLTIFQEQETDETVIAAYNAIINAFAIICKNAYLDTGTKYFPEPIELVDESTFNHMIESLNLCFKN